MAAYPSIGLRHTIAPVTQRSVDVSDAGTIRSVDLSTGVAYSITIEHPLITTAQVTTLESFYSTNKTASNTITLRGVSYTFQFSGAYTIQSVNSNWYNASVNLIATKT